jgi:hypothetical protein
MRLAYQLSIMPFFLSFWNNQSKQGNAIQPLKIEQECSWLTTTPAPTRVFVANNDANVDIATTVPTGLIGILLQDNNGILFYVLPRLFPLGKVRPRPAAGVTQRPMFNLSS